MAEVDKQPAATKILRAGPRAVATALPSFAGVSPRARSHVAIFLVAAAALLFPIVHGNDADIDSAANALAFAALALGLNIVVGFAGLLDLGYAAFFAIGAYAYGVSRFVPAAAGMVEFLGAVPLARPRRPNAGSERRRNRPFSGVVLADAADLGDHRRIFRRAVRRPDPAAQRRLPGDRHFGFRRDRADRGAQHPERYQWCDGAKRGRRTAAIRLHLRGQRHTLLLCRRGARGIADRHQLTAQGFANRPSLDGDPRRRDRRRGNGGKPRPLQIAGVCDRRRLCRRYRHPLCREIADRDTRDVHVPGLGHDPCHDRLRRDRQRLGRRCRRPDTADAAIMVSRRSVAMAARAGPADQCRVAAAYRVGLVDRADLRADPGLYDALSPRRVDPGDPANAGAEPRPAIGAGGARRL